MLLCKCTREVCSINYMYSYWQIQTYIEIYFILIQNKSYSILFNQIFFFFVFFSAKVCICKQATKICNKWVE